MSTTSLNDRKPFLDNRYQVLAASSIYTYDDENLTSYVDFLGNFGRYICKDGYIDSDSTIHRYKLKQKDFESKNRFATETPTTYRKAKSKSESFTHIDILNRNEMNQKNYEKHLRVIEDQMIKSKQEERALKRQEGDVKKEQRTIRNAMRDLDYVLGKKYYSAEKNLSKNLEEKQRIEVENTQNKELNTKERTKQHVEDLQRSKDNNRRFLVVYNDLSRKYKHKISELNRKHTELQRLNNDFVFKMRTKEEEEARLKKEIAEITLAMNMEANKAKTEAQLSDRDSKKTKSEQVKTDLCNETMLNEKLGNTNNYIKTFDLTRRRITHDGDTQKAEWMLRQREAKRRLIDIRNNLDNTYTTQFKLIDTADTADRDKQAYQTKEKLDNASSRKNELNTKEQIERDNKIAFEHSENEKARNKLLDIENQKKEECLKSLQKYLQKENVKELELYQQVKEIEFERRNKEKELDNLEDKLSVKQRDSAYLVKHLSSKINHEEENIKQTILKEKALLHQLQFDREDAILKLLAHRDRVKEYKYQLENYQKEHQRMANILSTTKD